MMQMITRDQYTNGIGLLTCIGALLFGVYYLQGTLYLNPCPLCLIDRMLLIAMAVVFFIGLVHRSWQRIYSIINVVIVSLALGVAGRHIWLQNLPADKVPECGAGLYHMLDVLPLTDVLTKVFTGSGECAAIQWTFLGLTIPEQTLLLFVFLLLLILLQLWRNFSVNKGR